MEAAIWFVSGCDRLVAVWWETGERNLVCFWMRQACGGLVGDWGTQNFCTLHVKHLLLLPRSHPITALVVKEAE